MPNILVNGVGDDKHKEGFTSWEGICFTKRFLICLDSKARLVLPLEIREAIGIETNGKILVSVSAGQSDKVILELSKASDRDAAGSVTCSKNCAYARKDRGRII